MKETRQIRFGFVGNLLALLACVVGGFILGLRFNSRVPHSAAVQTRGSNVSITAAPTTRAPGAASTRPASFPLVELKALLVPANASDPAILSKVWPLIDRLSLSECRPALAALRQFRHRENALLLDALAQRWSNLDPVDAFNSAQANREDNDWRNRLGFAASAALATSDPETALAKITSTPNNEAREKAAEWILPQLAKHDPLRASDYLASNQNLVRYSYIYRNVAEAFGQSSPQQALAWARSFTNQDLRAQSLAGVWIGWAENDPVGAATALRDNPDQSRNSDLITTLAHTWARADMNSTLQWIQSLNDAGVRNNAYRSLDSALAQLAPDQVREILLRVDSEDARNRLAQSVAQNLASVNIQDAIAWAEKLPADKSRSQAFSSILNQWAYTDAPAAARYIISQSQSAENGDSLRTAMTFWSQSDVDSAYNFLQTLDGSQHDAAASGIAATLTDRDPKKAAELFQSIHDKDALGRLSENLAQALVKTDPNAAFELATQIPEDAQPKFYYSLIRNWAFDHTTEAGQWLNTLPSGAARDSAIKAYVSVIDGTDAGSATRWAFSITDPTERMETTYQAFERWLQEDRRAATAWLEKSDMPEGLQPFFDRLLTGKKAD